jgi:hypothetical protein
MTNRSVHKNSLIFGSSRNKKVKKSGSSSWQSYQSTGSSSKKGVWLGLLALGLLVGLILLGKLIGFLVSINSPYNPVSKSEVKHTSWDQQTNLSFSVQTGESWSIFSLNPHEKTLVVIKIPPQLQLEEFNSPEQSKIVFRNLLGLPITGYWIFPDQKNPEKLVEELRTNLPAVIPEIKTAKTDLSPKEMFLAVTTLRDLRFDKIKFIDLAQSDSTKWIVKPGEGRVLTLDSGSLDHYLNSYIIDSKLSAEGLTIGIYNATRHPGLAEKAARLITNIGGRVVLTASSQKKLDKTLIMGNKSYSYSTLVTLFNLSCKKPTGLFGFIQKDDCATLISEMKQDSGDINLSRADVVIIIGEDYYQQYALPMVNTESSD